MADIFKAMFIIVSSFINIFYMQATIYKYDIHNLEHTVVDSYMPKDRFKFQFHAVEQKKTTKPPSALHICVSHLCNHLWNTHLLRCEQRPQNHSVVATGGGNGGSRQNEWADLAPHSLQTISISSISPMPHIIQVGLCITKPFPYNRSEFQNLALKLHIMTS